VRFQSALRRVIERRAAELSSPNYALLGHESNRRFPPRPRALGYDYESLALPEFGPFKSGPSDAELDPC
jgi:hypothetical protein